MPATIKAMLSNLFVLVALCFAAYRTADMSHVDLPAIGAAFAGFACSAWSCFATWRVQKKLKQQAKKIELAETIVPGITSVPKGSEVSGTIRVNDPQTQDPPTEIPVDVRRTP